MDNIICRKLLKTDYDQFHILINDFRETTFSREQFEKILSLNTNCEILVFEQDGSLIATGKIMYEYKFIFNISCLAHIEDVCVKKEFRDKGFGKYIIKELINLAKQNNCYKVTLDCSDENKQFYEKCNFERRGNQMSMLI